MNTVSLDDLLNIDNYPGLLPDDILNSYITNFTDTFNAIPEDSYARKPLDTNIKLMNYYKTISNKDAIQIRYALIFCQDLKKFLSNYVKNKYSNYNIKITIKGRIKSPISTLTKFRNSIYEYMQTGKDLDNLNIHDLFAFRVIITVMDKSNMILGDEIAIPICYDIVEQAVKFAKKYQYMETLPSKPRSDKDAPIIYSNVVCPTTRPKYITENENIIKDYIFYPKRNTNYQSNHIKLKLSIPDNIPLYLEMQLRTYKMNEHAERGPASHLMYKSRNILSFTRVPQIFEEQEDGKFEFVNMDKAFKEFFGIELSDINPALSYDKLREFLDKTNYKFPVGLLQISRDTNGNPILSAPQEIVQIPIEVMVKKVNTNNATLEALALNIFSQEKENLEDIIELS